MRQLDLYNISLSQILHFLTLGKIKNYTKTAELNFVTQPTISRSIEILEKQLGIQLFVKDSSGLRLTPAGQSLHHDLLRIISDMQISIENAHILQTGRQKRISIGFLEHTNPYDYIIPIANQYKRIDKYCDFSLKPLSLLSFQDSFNDLLNGNLDLIFASLHNKRLFESPFISYKTIYSCKLGIAISTENPYSACESFDLSDLNKFKYISIKQSIEPSLGALISDLFFKAGIIPVIAGYASSLLEALYSMQDPDTVIFADQTVSNLHLTSNEIPLKIVDINNTESGIIIIWRKKEPKESQTKQFIGFVVDNFELFVGEK